MRIMFLGDIVGARARQEIYRKLPRLRSDLGLDAVVVNGENAAHGFGITAAIASDLIQAGVDVITAGNHVWNQKEAVSMLESSLPIIRPANYPDGTPGRGTIVVGLKNGQRLGVMHFLGRTFMQPLDDPFTGFDRHALRLKEDADALVVDFHAEATSEKVAFGLYLNGRASLVAGTHTHVPTADHRVLSKGTAYITDAGMCGDYDSVIGMDKAEPLSRFLTGIHYGRFTPADKDAALCGVIVDTDDDTGLATGIKPFRMGPGLENTD
ncbi:MAG: TIGR00282 family metallophosphoesterase [Alphaproteobacteria bacterium]|nr:TIGR00282 family metallophosphoesterase [Alphaproteobacteria bacterium]